jgi:hypothetical protein
MDYLKSSNIDEKSIPAGKTKIDMMETAIINWINTHGYANKQLIFNEQAIMDDLNSTLDL